MIVLIYVAYYGISPLFRNVVLDEQVPVPQASVSTSTQIKISTIVDTPTHPASGAVKIIATSQGQYVRYENFKTINGPDLFVYLANDLDAKDFVNLGELKATEGNVNYKVPDGFDVTKYKYVMVWCKQFGVLFNYADISNL